MFQTVRAFAMLRQYTAEEMAERSANGITAGRLLSSLRHGYHAGAGVPL